MLHPADIRKLLDDEQVDVLLAQVPLEEIAAAYCRYSTRVMATDDDIAWEEDPDGWAAQLYSEFGWSTEWSGEDEQRLRTFLTLIIEGAPNADVLSFFGAGALEDFLTDTADRLAWVEEQAAASTRFREALRNVWLSGFSHESFLRMERAAGQPLKPQTDPEVLRRTAAEQLGWAEWFEPSESEMPPQN